MKRPTPDKAWFQDRLRILGRSQADIARALKLDRSAVTEILKGSRHVKITEAEIIARELMAPLNEVLTRLGIGQAEAERPMLKVVGYVGAGDQIHLYDAHADDNVLEEIPAPFPGYKGRVCKIRGSSAAPRYLDGEYIAFTPNGHDIGKYLGREVVAETEDRALYFKRLQRGSQPDTYTLVSINPMEPPIVNVRLNWVSPIDFHIPA